MEPIPEGTYVIYEGTEWKVIQHLDPATHPKLSKIRLSPQDFAAQYPDGVAYWIHPKDMLPVKMDGGAYSRVFVRRSSIEPVT